MQVEIVSPTRKFLREGTIKEVKGTKIQDIQYFIFNDLVVRAKPKNRILGSNEGLFVCKTQIPVSSLLVRGIEDSRKLLFLLVLALNTKQLWLHSTICLKSFMLENPNDSQLLLKPAKR